MEVHVSSGPGQHADYGVRSATEMTLPMDVVLDNGRKERP
jgi:hypothetical protein